MNQTPSPSCLRRQRRKACDARHRGEVPAKPRKGDPKLTRIERAKLRAGCLRRVEPGDNITTLAVRLNQSPECVREALAHDIRCVDELLEGGKCAEIALTRPEWTPAFVDLARRQIFGRRDRKARAHAGEFYDLDGGHTRKGGNEKPWKNFSRGKSTARRNARQKKLDDYAKRTAQRARIQEAEESYDLAHLGDGAVLPGDYDHLLDAMSEGINFVTHD